MKEVQRRLKSLPYEFDRMKESEVPREKVPRSGILDLEFDSDSLSGMKIKGSTFGSGSCSLKVRGGIESLSAEKVFSLVLSS